MKALIESYKRFEIHDGPGVRTTVFFKGCPLRCKWCHNPECLKGMPELGYDESRCIRCGECVSVCEQGAHRMSPAGHLFGKTQCVACGKCADVCLGSALKYHGRREELETVLAAVLEDQAFYGDNGGVTVSGGEPLMQSAFVARLLEELKKRGIHTAVDTSLYCDRKDLDAVLPYTDLFLPDLKAYDEQAHIAATGVSNKQILEAFRYLDAAGAEMEIRIPFVHEYNGDQILPMARFIAQLHRVRGVRLLPYHDFANNKYHPLGLNPAALRLPEEGEIERAKEQLRSFGIRVLA